MIIDIVVLHAGTTDDIEALSGELFGHIEVAGSFILVARGQTQCKDGDEIENLFMILDDT